MFVMNFLNAKSGFAGFSSNTSNSKSSSSCSPLPSVGFVGAYESVACTFPGIESISFSPFSYVAFVISAIFFKFLAVSPASAVTLQTIGKSTCAGSCPSTCADISVSFKAFVVIAVYPFDVVPFVHILFVSSFSTNSNPFGR